MSLGMAVAIAAVLGVLTTILWVSTDWATDGRLGPNKWIGIRTRATRRSDKAWMAAHRAARLTLRLIAVLGYTTCVALVAIRPNDGVSLAILVGGCGSMVVLSIAAKLIGDRAARSMSEA